MRVVMPYVADTCSSPIARFAFERYAPQGESIALDATDPEAYWRLLCELWKSGDDFAIVEHDNELHAGVLPAFLSCPDGWCVFPYWGEKNPFRAALGCTRFRTGFCSAFPNLVEELPLRRWDRLDSQIATLLHRQDCAACEHEPYVKHHHDYTRRPPRTPRSLCQRFPGGTWV